MVVGVDVMDVAIYVVVAAIDPFEFLLKVLVDQLVAIEEVVKTIHGCAGVVDMALLHGC